ncbi:MAG TPA: glycosyltransferase family 4 protein [Nitrospiria bacterium]|nr:glycosyltransferase family 4 protein [Nitrospiria bacterium]
MRPRQSGERIRVLHLITRLDRGGSAENTLLTVTGLDPKRYRVMLASGASGESRMTPDEQTSLDQRLTAADAVGVERVMIPSLVRRLSPWRDAAALLAMCRLIRAFKPHIVHTHTSKAGALGRVAARLCGVPLVVHTPHGHIFYGYYGRLLSACAVAAERWLGRMTDALIALTEAGRQEYLERRIAPSERLHAVHSGIQLVSDDRGRPTLAAARRDLGLLAREPVIGILGRLVPIKGHRYLIEALPAVLKEFPSALLLVVGEGPERDSLASLAASLGVSGQIRMIGARSDLLRYVAACDVIVQPSLNEGMGRTVLEALVMGKPVIASQVGGLPDLIVHGRNGLLVPPASPSALAHAICSLCWDPVRLRRMSGEARRSVGRQFSVAAMVEAIDRLYGDLLLRVRIAHGVDGVAEGAVRQAGRRRQSRSTIVDGRRCD